MYRKKSVWVIHSQYLKTNNIRFDTALKISNILDIPINSICKDNPYAPGQSLPELPSDKEIMMTSFYKKAYISERTFDLLKKFDYTELNIVDKLIADFFVLDDVARSELFEYLRIMKKNHSDPERKKLLRPDKSSKKGKR